MVVFETYSKFQAGTILHEINIPKVLKTTVLEKRFLTFKSHF